MPTPSDPQPVPLHGVERRRRSLARLRVRRRTGLEQDLHGPILVFADGDHQRGLSELGLTCIDVRAALEQGAKCGRRTGTRRRHQRGLASRIDGIRIDAGIEQAADQIGVAVDRGEIERRHAVAIDGRRFRSGTQQCVHDVQTIGVNGGVQRGHAVDARRIDGNLLADERAHRGEVAACRRIDERRRRFGRACRCRQQQSEEPCRGKGRASAQSQKHQRILSPKARATTRAN